MNGHGLHLPFEPDQLVDNLLLERYVAQEFSVGLTAVVRSAYYGVRPLLSTGIRKHLQRMYMARRGDVHFPAWPLDCTVERILEKFLVLVMRAHGLSTVPFIWFWPEGFSSCATLTHDVETERGRDFCLQLMDFDEAAGLQSAFQIVPEQRYFCPPSLLREMRDRGFEINVHDLNHDGRLFANRDKFLKRAERINQYATLMGARGFRSGALYRNQDWFAALDFEYDMSVPNCGHWEAQFGGCCTVFPYFMGNLVELPFTTVQDYVLFKLWDDYSINFWEKQSELIREKHGLVMFLTHPDYLLEPRSQRVYQSLLELICGLRNEQNVWFALPGEINDWWRARSQMNLVRETNGDWCIEGRGSERARVALAHLQGDTVVYEMVDVSRLCPA